MLHTRLVQASIILSLALILAACGSAGAHGPASMQQNLVTPAPTGGQAVVTPPAVTPPPAQDPPPDNPPPPPFTCPAGTEDMVSWMMPSDMSFHFEGNHDYKSFYLRPGRMYFVKNRQGWPLDEKLYDHDYIYDFITENGADGWHDPSDIKEFVNPVKLAPRCIPIGSPGQRVASVTNTDTRFVSKMSCNIVSRNQLGTVVGQVWNQGMHDFGLLDENGNPMGPVDTRVLTYRWSCDQHFANCHAREELWLARGYGWVEWKLYVLQNGQYVLMNDTIGTHAASGAPIPYQPCGDDMVQ